jgi:OOP family OmpA-OmpF porin
VITVWTEAVWTREGGNVRILAQPRGDRGRSASDGVEGSGEPPAAHLHARTLPARKRTSWPLAAQPPVLAATLAAGLTGAPDEVSAEENYRASAGAFAGGNLVSREVELGNAFFDDQVPGSGPLFGMRLAYALFPALAPHTAANPRLSLELESKFTASSLRGDPEAMRPTGFAPVLGLRAHALLDFLSHRPLSPFLLLGFSAETLFADSVFVSSVDTDSAMQWGLGVNYAIAAQYGIRFDLRQLITAGRTDTFSLNHEAHLGFYYHFNFARRQAEAPPRLVEAQPPPAAPVVTDTDGDGLADERDRCPSEREVINQIDDDDGCPEIDSDNDGLLGTRDGCPEAAEDVDGFEDDNGCPDGDNDADGRPDVIDECPREAEALNGFKDEDGCPDEVPQEVAQFTGTIDGIYFGRASARILSKSRPVLNRAVEVLKNNPSVRIEIGGHTSSEGDHKQNLALSRKRADAVKWYLVDKGIADARITTAGYGPDRPLADNGTPEGRARNRRIEFVLLPGPRTVPDPRTGGATTGETPGATPAGTSPPAPAPATPPAASPEGAPPR